MARTTRQYPSDDPLLILIRDHLRSSHKLATNSDMRSKNMYNAARQVEIMLHEHFYAGAKSQLHRLIGDTYPAHLQLPFKEAFSIYDQKYCVSRRENVLITTDEVRQILNIATVVSLVRGNVNVEITKETNHHSVRLITFDGDGTLYDDGENFACPRLASQLSDFLKRGIHVALVTAAGYGYEFDKYHGRINFLINHFREQGVKSAPDSGVGRFFVFGGECNYLMELDGNYNLAAVPEKFWVKYHSHLNNANEIQTDILLDLVERTMRQAEEDLCLRTRVIRKDRGVGLVSAGNTERVDFPDVGRSGLHQVKTEILDEVVHRCRNQINSAGLKVEHCIFNGGADVWCDIGNKAIGCTILLKMLGIPNQAAVHIGDQFDENGNDLAARRVMPTIFVTEPHETRAVLNALIRQLDGLTSNYTIDSQKISAQCLQRFQKGTFEDSDHGLTLPTNSPIVQMSPSDKLQSLKHMSTVANIMFDDEAEWDPVVSDEDHDPSLPTSAREELDVVLEGSKRADQE